MKISLFTVLLMIGLQAKAQDTLVSKDPVVKHPNPTIIRGIDISTASPNQQDFILFMETLSDEQAFEILKTLVSGEIHYKKAPKEQE
jgi:hypothetical protein